MTRPLHSHLFHAGQVPTSQLATGTATAGYAPLSNGGGTVTWGQPSIAPVYAALEMNTAPVCGTAGGSFVWDTFYDRAGGVIGSLPAGLAVTLSGGATAINFGVDGLWAVTIALDVDPSPGHAASVGFPWPGGFVGHPDLQIAHPNTLGYVIETRVTPWNATQQLLLAVSGTAGDTPVNYAAIEIVRLA